MTNADNCAWRSAGGVKGARTYGTEQSLLMRLLTQLNATYAHSCLRRGPSPAACVSSGARSTYLLLSARHPEYDLDLMILLQGCSRSVSAPRNMLPPLRAQGLTPLHPGGTCA